MLLLYDKNEITAAMGVISYSNWSFSNNLKDKFIAFLLKKLEHKAQYLYLVI